MRAKMLSAAAVGLTLAAVAWAAGPISGKQVVLQVPDFRDGAAEDVDKQTNAFAEAHRLMIGRMIGELRRAELSNASRVRLVYLLGELRSPKATWILIENINLVD